MYIFDHTARKQGEAFLLFVSPVESVCTFLLLMGCHFDAS